MVEKIFGKSLITLLIIFKIPVIIKIINPNSNGADTK